MATLHFREALLPDGWAADVRITIAEGRIATIAADAAAGPDDERHAAGVPGLGNVHSHAFQRGMAGLTETRGPAGDSFWTWREIMYRFVARVSPDDLAALAALAYAEMLEAGFTRVGEFHYLHHDIDGASFADPAEMSGAIVAAAAQTGIGLTHLPVFYAHAGFGGTAPDAGQRRFVCGVDRFARLVDAARSAARALPDAVVGVAPHSLRAVTQDELLAVARLAEGGPVHIHIAEQQREVDDCLAWSGQRPVEWLFDHAPVDRHWCLVHATQVTEAETRRLAASGAVAGLCPITEANLGDGIFPAVTYREGGGRFGIGSDSNVMIDAAEELRTLEYGQRLIRHGRNLLADRPGDHTGNALYRGAQAGGCHALGVTGGLAVGCSADIVSLDTAHPSMLGRGGAALLDGFVFAAGRHAVDCVWRAGIKVVRDGQHTARREIRDRYARVLTRLIG